LQKLLEVIIRVLHYKSHWTTPCSSKIKCNYVHPLSKCLERKKNEVRQVNQNPFKNIDKYTLLSSSFLPVGLTGRGKFSFSLLLFFSLFLCVWVSISFFLWNICRSHTMKTQNCLDTHTNKQPRKKTYRKKNHIRTNANKQIGRDAHK